MNQPALLDIEVAATEPVVLEVFGIPQPQGSKTGYFNKHTKRVVIVEGRRPEARAAFASWRQGIADVAQREQEDNELALCDQPCRITIGFRLPRPKSAPKRRVWPDRKPDIDKLARAVLDALTGTLITDDARVCSLIVTKTFAGERPPGATITLEVL
jgi:Holliday junction resolvase RusA-like endonuclease